MVEWLNGWESAFSKCGRGLSAATILDWEDVNKSARKMEDGKRGACPTKVLG